MLKAGRALLLLEGYIPDDGSQHKTVVEMTSAIFVPFGKFVPPFGVWLMTIPMDTMSLKAYVGVTSKPAAVSSFRA